MGKRRQLPAALRAIWQDRNGPSLGVTVRSRKQYYFWASCGQHSRLLQPGSAAKALRRDGELRCPICQPTAGQTSRHVPAVQQAADSTGLEWQAEHYCLPGHSSPADIWFPQLRLAVQIDGAHHRYVSIYSAPAERQQEVDARFDSSIIRHGLRALRIDYKDAARPAAALAAAIFLCQLDPAAAFVMYSTSYHRPIQWVAVDEP